MDQNYYGLDVEGKIVGSGFIFNVLLIKKNMKLKLILTRNGFVKYVGKTILKLRIIKILKILHLINNKNDLKL